MLGNVGALISVLVARTIVKIRLAVVTLLG